MSVRDLNNQTRISFLFFSEVEHLLIPTGTPGHSVVNPGDFLESHDPLGKKSTAEPKLLVVSWHNRTPSIQ